MPDVKETVSVLAQVNWAQVFAAIFASFFSHSLSLRLGNGTLTASVGGVPTHLSPDAILAAAVMAFSGVQASITVGTVTVTFTPDTAAAAA